MQLATPDVVGFDYRRPSGTCRCPSPLDGRRRAVGGLPCDEGGSSSSPADFDAVCRSVTVDPDMRLVQSAVTGDWRFVTQACSHPEVLEPGSNQVGPRRRRYGNARPQGMGVGSSDLRVVSRTVDTESNIAVSFAGQVGVCSSVTGTAVSSPGSVDYAISTHHHGDAKVDSATNVDLTPSPFRGVTCSSNVAGEDEIVRDFAASVSGPERDVAEDCRSTVERSGTSAAGPFGSQLLRQLTSSSPGGTDPIPTSPSGVGSNNTVVHRPSYKDETSCGYKTGPDDGVSLMSGPRRAEVAKSCSLSAQFASDADLEADLLSAKLLREFREAVRAAVDSISVDGCRPDVIDVALNAPCSRFAAAQSLVSVERVEEFADDSLLGSSSSVLTSLRSRSMSNSTIETRTESAYRKFRLSNIPTLNGVSRCARSQVVDDLTTVTQRSPVTPNVLRHRRSLPDASRLRSLSSPVSSRDASMSSRPTVRTRCSLANGNSNVRFLFN